MNIPSQTFDIPVNVTFFFKGKDEDGLQVGGVTEITNSKDGITITKTDGTQAYVPHGEWQFIEISK